MTDKPRDKKKGRWATVPIVALGVTVLLLVLYVLSDGPAARLLVDGVISKETYFTIYGPLQLAEEHLPAFGRVAGPYFWLWVTPKEFQDAVVR